MKNLVEACSEQLHLIETSNLPRVETALLRKLLAPCPEQKHGHAGANDSKHRLHALRCENVNLRLRIQELETQLNQMRATRGWIFLEKVRRWRRTASRWFQPFSKLDKSEPRP